MEHIIKVNWLTHSVTSQAFESRALAIDHLKEMEDVLECLIEATDEAFTMLTRRVGEGNTVAIRLSTDLGALLFSYTIAGVD